MQIWFWLTHWNSVLAWSQSILGRGLVTLGQVPSSLASIGMKYCPCGQISGQIELLMKKLGLGKLSSSLLRSSKSRPKSALIKAKTAKRTVQCAMPLMILKERLKTWSIYREQQVAFKAWIEIWLKKRISDLEWKFNRAYLDFWHLLQKSVSLRMTHLFYVSNNF